MNKIFYHSITGEQFKPNDCSEDSEDEIDSTWIKESEEKQIDELTNINQKEKEFMKLWNHHIYEINSSDIIPNIICIKFINKYFKEISTMMDQWGLHLITLLEYHILTGDNLLYLQLLLKKKIENALISSL